MEECKASCEVQAASRGGGFAFSSSGDVTRECLFECTESLLRGEGERVGARCVEAYEAHQP